MMTCTLTFSVMTFKVLSRRKPALIYSLEKTKASGLPSSLFGFGGEEKSRQGFVCKKKKDWPTFSNFADRACQC